MTIKHLLDNDLFFSALTIGHPNYRRARVWLDNAKPGGWGIAVETYLSAMRLLMNPTLMGSSVFTAEKAIAIIEEELTGEHPGRIVFAKEKPAAAIVGRARGHKQVMDFWLVQLARQEGCKLATLDEGTLANWPDVAVRV